MRPAACGRANDTQLETTKCAAAGCFLSRKCLHFREARRTCSTRCALTSERQGGFLVLDGNGSDGAAVVHNQDLAVAALGFIAGEEQDGVGLVVHGDLGDGVVEVAGALGGELTVEGGDGLGGVQLGGGGAGATTLQRMPVLSELDAHVLAHGDDGGLGGGVGDA